MSDNSQNSQRANPSDNDTPGANVDNSSGPTPAEKIGAGRDSHRDAADGSISEVKARDPEYYAERDIPDA